MYGLTTGKRSSGAKKKTATAKKGGKKMTKAELSAMGKKITARAKQIRAKSPGMKWQTAMAKAGREFKKK